MPKADLILKANVITMDPGRPRAELVAVRGDRVLLAAGDEELGSLKGPDTRVIDCRGKTVVPGLNDAHCHVFSFIRKLLSLDLSPSRVGSIGDIKAAVRRRAENTPRGRWITGSGYNEFYLAEKRHPTRWDIDEVAPHHPVVLAHRSLHACVLNSLALSLAGITSETPESPGAVIDRDLGTGEPNGLLFEMLGYIREKVLPPLTEEELLKGMDLASEHYLSLGITSLQEATVANDFSRWQSLRRFKDLGKLKSRVAMMLGSHATGQFQDAGLTTGSGDSELRLGGVKVILSQATGRLEPSLSELKRQALNAHRSGFQLAIHAVEESTVRAAITALEYVRNRFPRYVRRHRIEHCSECPPELLERLRGIGAVVATQPPFLYYSGERYLATLSARELEWLYPIGSLLSSGLVVAGSSDCPVVPDNPLVGIYAAVTRRAESGEQLSPGECIPAHQALAMYTVNAAFASFEEGIKGAIAPGKLGDMAVLSDDPTRLPPEEIKDIRVEMTIIGGQVVWEG